VDIAGERMPTSEDRLLCAFVELGKLSFAMDVDRHQVEEVLAVSLRLNPSNRNLGMVCQLLRYHLVEGNHNTMTSELLDTDLGFSPVTQLSHVENLLV
jgi:hypothetical protein